MSDEYENPEPTDPLPHEVGRDELASAHPKRQRRRPAKNVLSGTNPSGVGERPTSLGTSTSLTSWSYQLVRRGEVAVHRFVRQDLPKSIEDIRARGYRAVHELDNRHTNMVLVMDLIHAAKAPSKVHALLQGGYALPAEVQALTLEISDTGINVALTCLAQDGQYEDIFVVNPADLKRHGAKAEVGDAT